MKTILHLFLCMMFLAACGKDSGAPAPSKELFSVWTSDGDGSVMDLTGGSFGVALTYSGVTTGGEICDCDLALMGTQSAGNWVLSSCTYRPATGGGVDPGCAAGNDNGTYTNSSAVLSICYSNGTCDTNR